MLNPNDILSLEERWKKWKWRKSTKPILLIVLAIMTFSSSWYGYSHFIKNSSKNHISTAAYMEEQKPKQEKKTYSEVMLNASNDNNKTPQALTLEERPRLALSIQPIPRAVQTQKIPLPEQEELSLNDEQEDSLESKNTNINPRIDSLQASRALEQKNEEHDGKKIEIKMHSSDADTTNYLKEKFDATGNIVFALMVSEEYYHMNNYNDAIRWALTANEIDPKNERSWILFAQSKVKLGYTKEAIMALEEFLKANNSGKIESLLIKIKRGAF